MLRSKNPTLLKKKTLGVLLSVVRGVFLAGICFVVLYPLVSKLFYSFTGVSDVFNPRLTYLPSLINTDNYKAALSILEYAKALPNTFFLSITSAVIQMVSAVMVAYALARFKFRLRNLLFVAVIIAMVIPPDLLLLPRYFQFRFFDVFGILKGIFGTTPSLIDTPVPFWLLGITCTGLKNGLYVFILRQHFMGLPKALEEAAEVDGAGPIRTFLQIALPGSVNTLITVFLFSFVWQWNDSIYSPVFLNAMPVLSNKISQIPAKAGVLLGTASSDIASSLVASAGILLIMVPLIALYTVTQRFFTQSIESSGMVG